MQTNLINSVAVDEVAGWRRGQLAAAGFAVDLADAVARDECYDLHALIELAERGCAPELAVRIVAPLEEERTA
jgi:hypothetical protein